MAFCYSSLNGLRQLQMFLACYFPFVPLPPLYTPYHSVFQSGSANERIIGRRLEGGRRHRGIYPPCLSFLSAVPVTALSVCPWAPCSCCIIVAPFDLGVMTAWCLRIPCLFPSVSLFPSVFSK